MSKRALRPVDLDLDAPSKDLSRLFASSLSSATDIRHAVMVPLDRLLDSPYQPRTRMSDESLDELAGVIRAQGFQGVLAARPHPERGGMYQLTAGHRRREASKRAGLPALPVVVRDLTDEEMVTLAITENIQRDDLTPLEEGRIYLLMNREMGYKLEQIGREVGKTLGYIYNRVRAAKAPPDVQAFVEAKPDSLRAVANLIKVESEQERAEIIKHLLAGTLTTDDLPIYIRDLQASEAERASAMPLLMPYIPPSLEESPGSGLWVAGAGSTTKLDDEPVPSIVLLNGEEITIERSVSPALQRRADETLNRDEQARSRARRSKLSRMLHMLQNFSDDLGDAAALSREERIELGTIAVLAERLCGRLGIDKDAL